MRWLRNENMRELVNKMRSLENIKMLYEEVRNEKVRNEENQK